MFNDCNEADQRKLLYRTFWDKQDTVFRDGKVLICISLRINVHSKLLPKF